jgi:hypothetical protein
MLAPKTQETNDMVFTDKKGRTAISVFDVLVTVAVLSLAVGLFLLSISLTFPRGEYFLVTSQNGEIYEKCSLLEDASYSFEADGYHLTVVVADGAVCVSESDCPGGDCKSFGRISEKGESIVCVPSGIVIKILGGGENDAIAG